MSSVTKISLKRKPQLPDNFERNSWEKLRAAVHAVHAKQAVGHSLEELYRAVEDMCLQNLAATVYDRLRGECERHIERRLEVLLGQTPDVQAFLSLVQTCWADHCEQMHMLRSIFLYLDRTFVMQVARPRRARRPSAVPSRRLPRAIAPLVIFARRPRRNARSGRWACRFFARTSAAVPRSHARRCRGCWRSSRASALVTR